MKKLLALMLCVLMTISLTACTKEQKGTNSDTASTTSKNQTQTKPKPKKEYPYEAEYTEMGIPLAEYYTEGGVERCVWDIEYFDGGIYVGSGDYDKNKGPVYMTHYSFEKGKWRFDTGLPDEQIERFFIFDNKFYAAGCDPQTSWSYGNLYYMENGRWQVNNTIPGGVHNFDAIKFEGKLYVGLGVVEGNAPVQVTEDEKNWTSVYFYKDGNLIDSAVSGLTRVYDFFALDGELYAFLYTEFDSKSYYEIYRLDGDKFVYHSEMPKNIMYSKSMYSFFNQKVEFKGAQYFTTAYFYKSRDMKTAEQINLGDTTGVIDLRVMDDTLYVLCNEKIINEDQTEEFRVSVKMSKDGTEFTEMFHFNYPVRALCFTYANDSFYFGMGYGTKAKKLYEENGMVLSVENPL